MLSAPIRGFGKTAAMAASGFVGDSPLFLADYLLRFLRVLLLLSLWRMILGNRTAGGMAIPVVLTYTLIAEVFSEPLTCRTELDVALWNGSIATRVLRPMSLVAQFAADSCGKWAFGLCLFSLPLLLASPWLGVSPMPAGVRAGLLFPVSLALAVSVGLALEFLFGGWMLMLEQNPWAFGRMRGAVTLLLSGKLLPLPLLPWGLGAIFGWLPFAAVAAAPLQVYTGIGNPYRLMLLQAGWSVVLWLAAGRLWTSNRERLVAHGG